MDESKHEIHSQVDAITAGTASVVNLTAGRLGVGLCVCVKGKQMCTSSVCDLLRVWLCLDSQWKVVCPSLSRLM